MKLKDTNISILLHRVKKIKTNIHLLRRNVPFMNKLALYIF